MVTLHADNVVHCDDAHFRFCKEHSLLHFRSTRHEPGGAVHYFTFSSQNRERIAQDIAIENGEEVELLEGEFGHGRRKRAVEPSKPASGGGLFGTDGPAGGTGPHSVEGSAADEPE